MDCIICWHLIFTLKNSARIFKRKLDSSHCLVSVSPVLGYASPELKLMDGGEIRLSCIAVLGTPKPTLKWYKDGVPLQTSHHVTVTISFLISKLIKEFELLKYSPVCRYLTFESNCDHEQKIKKLNFKKDNNNLCKKRQ